MTDEAAKELAAAMNRLAAAIESLQSPGMLPGGIHVHRHGNPFQATYGPAHSGPPYRYGDHGF